MKVERKWKAYNFAFCARIAKSMFNCRKTLVMQTKIRKLLQGVHELIKKIRFDLFIAKQFILAAYYLALRVHVHAGTHLVFGWPPN